MQAYQIANTGTLQGGVVMATSSGLGRDAGSEEAARKRELRLLKIGMWERYGSSKAFFSGKTWLNPCA
ncbi:hypothetical protein DPMN_137503 [Dreissena polymorpha]|uniref:Uncharacterized protein n=1 Tax=Dreissena polymorpha TaxID=45954 RepID=A0A9D4G1Y2_DREPO|nr:hypothetical protein DPMN_137503 [Dreissena polymorpha]